MEIRQSLRTVPSRPVALAMAVLAVLALALTAWFVLGTRAQSTSQGTTRAPVTNQLTLDCSNDPYSPRDPICVPYHDPYSPHDPIN
jgi:hypothetical protein